MIRLSTEHYPRVRPLLGALSDHHLAVGSVLDRRFDAPIYADSESAPQAALTWTTSRAFLAGRGDDPAVRAGVRAAFADVFTPYAQAAQRAQFVLHAHPFDHWVEHVDDLFPGLYPVEGRRLTFVLRATDGPRPDWRAVLPDGYALHAVDADLLARADLDGLDYLRGELCSERASVDDFLRRSFGVCLVTGNTLAGWCLSEYDRADACEVGIEVVAEQRRRGLGTLLANAFAEAAFARGVTRIGWHCWADNVPSAALARAAGYTLVHEERVLFGFFNGALNLAIRGNFALGAGENDAAVQWFERALAESGELPAWVHFQAARAYARTGQAEAALHALEDAANRGWPDSPAPLLDHDDFAPLHIYPAWAALLARLESR